MSASLTLRGAKGSELTYEELDDNFVALSDEIDGAVRFASAQALTAPQKQQGRDNLGLGTMSTQNANTVAVTGGAIDNTPVGATTPGSGRFTTLTTTGNVGIGLTNPAHRLSVNGKVFIDNGSTLYIDPYVTGTYFSNIVDIPMYWQINSATKLALSSTGLSVTGKLTTNGIKEDASGNVGIRANISAWGSLARVLEFQNGTVIGNYSGVTRFSSNGYHDGTSDKYLYSNYASMYEQPNGGHTWKVAPSGTAGSAIPFTQAMATGSVSVTGAGNAAAAALKLAKDTTTNRSLNAEGTVNASGADYAEYERNNGLTIAKGQIVGFLPDGTLTDVFADAVRFGIKSTNPSYVGGDTWGAEDVVGKRPEQPTRREDVTETTGEGEDAVTVVIEAGDTDEEWAAKESEYQATLSEFEAKLEAERQKVDRIAYSGKVPCNVAGATPGDYIVASEADDGGIVGVPVSDPDFGQYKLAVGRVNRVLPDGRCEVAVIVH